MNDKPNVNHIYYIRQSAVISGTKQWREAQHIKWIKDAGYDVTLICSSFDHYNKTQRKKENLSHLKSYQIWSPGYRENKSVMRVIDAWVFSVKLFLFLLCKGSKKDMFICSFPSPEAAFGTKLASLFKGSRVVFDFRDAWPLAFSQSNWVGRAFAFYVNSLLRLILSKQSKMRLMFMSFGIRNYYKSKFQSIKNEFIIHNSAPDLDKHVSTTKQDAPIVFIGNINNQFSFDELLALNLNDEQLADIIILGGGERFEAVRDQFSNFDKVHVLGPVNYLDAMDKLASARATFFFYSNPLLFDNHITNKITEAISLRIPIITNLKKTSFDIWDDAFNIGVTIEDMDIRDMFQKDFVFPEMPDGIENSFLEQRVRKNFLEALFMISSPDKKGTL